MQSVAFCKFTTTAAIIFDDKLNDSVLLRQFNPQIFGLGVSQHIRHRLLHAAIQSVSNGRWYVGQVSFRCKMRLYTRHILQKPLQCD